MPQIIGIQECKQTSTRRAGTAISRCACASVFLPDQDYSFAVLPHNGFGVISRPIVDDNHLIISICLGKNRTQRPRQSPGRIECRYDNADNRAAHMNNQDDKLTSLYRSGEARAGITDSGSYLQLQRTNMPRNR
jgi:hypothetical protein